MSGCFLRGPVPVRAKLCQMSFSEVTKFPQILAQAWRIYLKDRSKWRDEVSKANCFGEDVFGFPEQRRSKARRHSQVVQAPVAAAVCRKKYNFDVLLFKEKTFLRNFQFEKKFIFPLYVTLFWLKDNNTFLRSRWFENVELNLQTTGYSQISFYIFIVIMIWWCRPKVEYFRNKWNILRKFFFKHFDIFCY